MFLPPAAVLRCSPGGVGTGDDGTTRIAVLDIEDQLAGVADGWRVLEGDELIDEVDAALVHDADDRSHLGDVEVDPDPQWRFGKSSAWNLVTFFVRSKYE